MNATSAPYTGYDIELAAVVFQIGLGVRQLQFLPCENFHDAYMRLRNGECDVILSAAESEWKRTLCTADCVSPPMALWSQTDYYAASMQAEDESVFTTECCLEVSAPYYDSALGLAVLSSSHVTSLWSTVNDGAVINWLLVIAIMVFVAGWLIAGIEYGNNKTFISFSDGVYYALSVVTTVGFGDLVPSTALGQSINMALMAMSVLVIAVFSALLSSTLTQNVLSQQVTTGFSTLPINALLCIENGYALPASVAAQNNRAVVEDTIQACLTMLESGQVGAVLHDIAILKWLTSKWKWGSGGAVYVTTSVQSNPFVAVFPEGSPLLAWANPAFMAVRSDPKLSALETALRAKYLELQGSVVASDSTTTTSRSLLWTLFGLAVATYLPRIRHFLKDVSTSLPSSMHAVAEREGELVRRWTTRQSLREESQKGQASRAETDAAAAEEEADVSRGGAVLRAYEAQVELSSHP